MEKCLPFYVLLVICWGSILTKGDDTFFPFAASASSDSGLSVTRQSDTCGGILTSQVGLINYKLGSKLGNESCIWTIQASHSENIKFHLAANGFNDREAWPIWIFDTSFHGSPENNKIKLSKILGPNRQLEVNVTGPLVYVLLSIDPYDTEQTGFSLYYEGFGREEFSNNDYELRHSSIAENPFGSYKYERNTPYNSSAKYHFPVFSMTFQVPSKEFFYLTVKDFVNELPIVNGTVNEVYDYLREVEVYEFFVSSTGVDVVPIIKFGNSDAGPFTSKRKYHTVVLFSSSYSENPNISVLLEWNRSNSKTLN